MSKTNGGVVNSEKKWERVGFTKNINESTKRDRAGSGKPVKNIFS
jgi:hypothetical protein